MRSSPGPVSAPRPRGAALLTAMVIVTLVATLASAMIWQQWRAVQVETAERARTQAHWLLTSAVDWARLLLREDARENQRDSAKSADYIGEPWSTPLAETKLSTFLALDKDNTEGAPEAFLSGSITDVQSRYNLRNLIDAMNGPASIAEAEQKVLERLLQASGARGDLAGLIVTGLRQANPTIASANPASAPGTVLSSTSTRADAPLLPQRIEQLTWLGVDAESIARLEPYLTLLPVRTAINVNTAPKEVLAAVIEGLDLSGAERIVQARQREHFEPKNLDRLRSLLPQAAGAALGDRVGTVSSFFEVRGRLRLEDRIVEERVLVERRNLEIVALRQQRVAGMDTTGQ